MSEYRVYEGQSLFDVSIAVYGRVDIVVDLAALNNISITDNLVSGQIIKLVDVTVNKMVKKAIENRNIIPATQYNY
jgi:phage major head subunit gpT-like protein